VNCNDTPISRKSVWQFPVVAQPHRDFAAGVKLGGLAGYGGEVGSASVRSRFRPRARMTAEALSSRWDSRREDRYKSWSPPLRRNLDAMRRKIDANLQHVALISTIHFQHHLVFATILMVLTTLAPPTVLVNLSAGPRPSCFAWLPCRRGSHSIDGIDVILVPE
jgi:hypothetical protein